MGMLDWFKALARSDGNTRTEARQTIGGAAGEKGGAERPAATATVGGDAEFAGLDFKTAIDAHMKWKIRLESYIRGSSDEALSVEVVCRDDQCPLGKWIYDKGGATFGYSETFFDMKAHHADFHRCAGRVLAAAQAGDREAALKLLHGGDYVKASERVKMHLARMFVIAAEGRAALDSHIKWKACLQADIAGESEEALDVYAVSRDDRCTLGQWLYGIGGERFGSLPAYAELKSRHARFHRCAGEVLAIARGGERRRALHMLEEGPYPEASEQVAAAIVALFGRNAVVG